MVDKIVGNQKVAPSRQAPATRAKAGKFQAILQNQLAGKPGIKLSAHAEKRLRERNITMTVQDLTRIRNAVEAAAAKGTREVLLVYGDLSLIASTVNKTVVTAVAREEGSVFTNIDGAVIIK